jgi:hypothetical protein
MVMPADLNRGELPAFRDLGRRSGTGSDLHLDLRFVGLRAAREADREQRIRVR